MGDDFYLEDFLGARVFIYLNLFQTILLLTIFTFSSWDVLVFCSWGMSLAFVSDLIILTALFWITFSMHPSLFLFVLFCF